MSLVAFIINIFVKAASLYSAVIITAVTLTGDKEELSESGEGDYERGQSQLMHQSNIDMV